MSGAGDAERLPPQPARLLELLVVRSGAIVTREEIREGLWRDTHVDFDTSLHFCVRQLRVALGDSGGEPRYVQNVPRRGYRLAGGVTRLGEVPATAGIRAAFDRRWRARRGMLVASVALVVAAAVWYSSGLPPRVMPVRIAMATSMSPA